MSEQDDIREFLKTVPHELLKAEWGRRRAAHRRAHNMGGRPVVLRTCPKCGRDFGTRDLRKHKPHCRR